MEGLTRKTKAELVKMVQQLTEDKTTLEKLQAITEEHFQAQKFRADDLQKKLELRNGAVSQEFERVKKFNAALLDLVEMSCRDHCPHHGAPDACRNCAIHQELEAMKNE